MASILLQFSGVIRGKFYIINNIYINELLIIKFIKGGVREIYFI